MGVKLVYYWRILMIKNELKLELSEIGGGEKKNLKIETRKK